MKITLIIAAALVMASAAYYLYLGSLAFRAELSEFDSTGDNTTAGRRERAIAISQTARDVYWHLSDGSRQRGFFLPSTNGALIIYAHGSPGAASGFHDDMQAMAEYGYGALAVDMPGYGESEGARNWGAAYRESIRKAIDFAEAQPGMNPDRIAGLGYSQGAHSMAKAAAEDQRLNALVLLAGYTNLYDQLHVQFRRRVPGMGFFAIAAAYSRGVDVLSMDTEDALAAVRRRPVLVVSGTADRVIPVHMAETLATTPGNVELWLIEDAGHIGFAEASQGKFYARLNEFFAEALLGDVPLSNTAATANHK